MRLKAYEATCMCNHHLNQIMGISLSLGYVETCEKSASRRGVVLLMQLGLSLMNSVD